jgi:hypothetical protein
MVESKVLEQHLWLYKCRRLMQSPTSTMIFVKCTVTHDLLESSYIGGAR